jgi:hypothetical protein
VARWGGLRPKGPGGLWRVSGASRRSRTYTRDHSRKPPRHYAEAFTRATMARANSPILIQKNSVALRGISSATRFRTRWRRTGSANALSHSFMQLALVQAAWLAPGCSVP